MDVEDVDPQEDGWKNNVGDEYLARTEPLVESLVPSRRDALDAVLRPYLPEIRTVLDLGAGAGIWIRALRDLLPDAHLTALDINAACCEACGKVADATIRASLPRFTAARKYDLVFADAVYSVISYERRPDAYRATISAAAGYVLVADYFSPVPLVTPYRDTTVYLYACPFADELRVTGDLEEISVLTAPLETSKVPLRLTLLRVAP